MSQMSSFVLLFVLVLLKFMSLLLCVFVFIFALVACIKEDPLGTSLLTEWGISSIKLNNTIQYNTIQYKWLAASVSSISMIRAKCKFSIMIYECIHVCPTNMYVI